MPECTICRHPERTAIEAALSKASAKLGDAAALQRVSAVHAVPWRALQKHVRHGVGAAEPADPPAQSGPTADVELLDLNTGSVHDRARALLAYLSARGRSTVELAQAREIRSALTLEARLVGAMGGKELHEHPDFAAWIDALVVRLAKLPGALDALEELLGAPEESERRAA
jgi:hypothetical protein